MPARSRHLTARRAIGLAAVSAAMAACNAAGATLIPTTTPAASAAAAPTGPTAFASSTFGVPFSLTLPAGWKVSQDEPNMFAAYISTDHETLDAGVDIQLVPKVHVDPCNKDAGTTAAGSTAADLAAWMLAFTPLGGTAGAPSTISGSKALVIDEHFAGTPCVNAELWPTDGGWLDAKERKRYFVFDLGNSRLVATLVSTDAKFDAELADTSGILASLHFTP